MQPEITEFDQSYATRGNTIWSNLYLRYLSQMEMHSYRGEGDNIGRNIIIDQNSYFLPTLGHLLTATLELSDFRWLRLFRHLIKVLQHKKAETALQYFYFVPSLYL